MYKRNNAQHRHRTQRSRDFVDVHLSPEFICIYHGGLSEYLFRNAHSLWYADILPLQYEITKIILMRKRMICFRYIDLIIFLKTYFHILF